MRTLVSICLAATVFLAGCAQFTRMNWKELQGFASVDFGEPTLKERTLVFPVEIDQKAGDSISVLVFRGRVERDMILTTASRVPVDVAGQYPHDLVVTLPKPHGRTYRLVYESPDGSRHDIREIDVPAE